MIGVLGEALIDLIGGVGDQGESCFYPHAGGCALNSATAAARLGSPVVYIGKLSQDMFGRDLQSYFHNNNVQLIEELCDVKEPTMIGFAKLDEFGAASYAFYTKGTTVTSFLAKEVLHVLSQPLHIRFLHVGSVSLALDSSGDAIVHALHALPSLPSLFFDPNVRPTVIQDFDLYRKRIMHVISLSTYIKLSHEDLSYIFPDLSVTQAINELFMHGVQHCILTKGKDGLQWISQSGIHISVEAIDNPIVDTVGAGDTVSGALLTYLLEHDIDKVGTITQDQAKEALIFAAKAASVTTSRKGANPPMRDEINLFAHLQKEE